jgi:hypothetical protein
MAATPELRELSIEKRKCRFKDEHPENFKFINFYSQVIQSNLCTATTLGPKKWLPLLTGGPCSEVVVYYINYIIEIGPLKWLPL